MTRILFLAYHFPPVGGGGVQRYVKFVRYLRELGHEPVVVTGSGGAADRWTPTDRTLARELGDVEIHRVPGPEPPIHAPGWRGRAERLLDRRSPYTEWWVHGAVEVGLRAGRGADVIFGGLVPYQSAEAAATLSRELDIPWVADLQDPWALDEMWLYPSYLHRRRDEQRMRRVLASSAAIVMNTPEAVERVRRRFPELADRLTPAIPNGLDPEDFTGSEAFEHDGGERFRIAHTGYLHTESGYALRRTGRLRRLLGGMPVPGVDFLTRSHVFLLAAVDRLLEQEPALRGVVEVHLAGVLAPLDREIADRTSYCRLHGYLSHDASIGLLRSSQLLFLPMHDLPPGTRAGLVPGKTYEYLGAKRPILAAVPDGDARDILAAAGNATICRPADVDCLARGIRTEIDRWRAGTQRPDPDPAVVARYERRRLTQDLSAVLESVAARDRSPGPQG